VKHGCLWELFKHAVQLTFIMPKSAGRGREVTMTKKEGNENSVGGEKNAQGAWEWAWGKRT
jgi:hypothetical protein